MDENASDALKIAAAVLIFVVALSITVMAFTKVRQAASSVMTTLDGTQKYYDTSQITLNGAEYKITSYRKVGAETIVPTLYAYYKEGYTILFYIGRLDGDGNLVIDSIKPMTLYYSEALDNSSSNNISQLQKSYLRVNPDATDVSKRAIYGLDINDELTRQEPWSYNEKYAKRFIECLINNYGDDDNNAKYYTSKTIYNNYIGSEGNVPYYKINYRYTDYLNGGQTNLINCTNKFIERVGQYNYDAVYSSTESSTESYNQTNLSGSVITFSNNEITENNSGNVKRVIQYIYIKN